MNNFFLARVLCAIAAIGVTFAVLQGVSLEGHPRMTEQAMVMAQDGSASAAH